MTDVKVFFEGSDQPILVPVGTLISEAAQQAGLELNQPCGGQGRCGRCAVQVIEGEVRRRSTLRLTDQDVKDGYALACQTVVEGDVRVVIPVQEKVERRLTSDRTAAEVQVPEWYIPQKQTVRRLWLSLNPPSVDDQTDDWSRLQTALRQVGVGPVQASLPVLRRIGPVLRDQNWQVTAVVDQETWDCPDCPARLIDLLPGHVTSDQPLWGAAIDIGTTTVSLWLVDLLTGHVAAQVAEYNGQIMRGEDVISRIIYASKAGGEQEMQQRVVQTINTLVERACQRVGCQGEQIMKATVTGNSTMIHLFLAIPAASIRLAPFVPIINQVPTLAAAELDLHIHPEATVDCLPGVASYVGADISAGVLSSGMADAEQVTLFMDVGTNGEIVLGSREWLVTCACSAGPAFEGAGVANGMRATKGAIEEVWINAENYEPNYRVIGGGKPRGICGSGLISLLAELFMTGVIDRSGGINSNLPTPRVRQREGRTEYVVAWAAETANSEDIAITRVDIDNLVRTKAAIYAGYTVLAQNVGLTLEVVEQFLIGGSFGKYINVEKAIQIGLLPDMPWEKFQFLGNTSVRGAYFALLDHEQRQRIHEIAGRMTYIELSADNQFYEAFMSAMFLPHTEMNMFPSVAEELRVGHAGGSGSVT